MGRKKKNQPYTVPDSILNIVNEHCNKGWMLFTYDDANQFRLYCKFDDPLVMKSLKSDLAIWLNALSEYEQNITLSNLIRDNSDNSGDPSNE